MPDNSKKAKNDKEQRYALLACYEALVASIDYLNRKQGDLNRLWRTMTRIHTRLTSIIINKNRQLEQLYFCQEEAFRLGLGNDSDIKPMLQELAESIDSQGSSAPSQKYSCVLCALIERFNTIRTGRIYQQNLNVKTYLKAFIMLMVVSIILILNHDLIMDEKNTPLSINNTNHNNPENPSISTSLGKDIGENGQIKIKVTSPDATGIGKNNLQKIIYTINNWFKTNMFFFVFFGGFAGGAFSLATRARKKDREHGEDVYSSIYVVTKPFIGALGAIIIYILMHTSFLTQNFIENKMIDSLRVPGAVTFGFSFIAGFSERLVFPQFR